MDSAELDARLIVGHALGYDTARLIAGERETVSLPQQVEIADLAERRLASEPVARLRGFAEFYGLDFELGPATLVPRPDTELLVDLALDYLRPLQGPAMADLGTGTGCIPIALLHEHPSLVAVATDLSMAALEVAKLNAQRHRVADRLQFAEGSWFAPFADDAKFDVITSNPPYVATPIIAGLAREVREHDPVLALDGGQDGLDAYRQILGSAAGHLRPGGRIMVEIGYDQADAVRLICGQSGLHNVSVHQDLAGHDRVIVACC